MRRIRQSRKRYPARAWPKPAGGKGALVLSLVSLVIGLLFPLTGLAGNMPALTVSGGCEIDYPPFCIVHEDGRVDGFSVELMRAALSKMGHKITFRTGPWAEVRGWLERGEVQALPLVGRTPERDPLFDFTVPYMTMHGAIVVRKGTEDVRRLADLRGRKVCVMRGDNAEEFLRRGDRGLEIITTTTFPDAFAALAEGRCEAVITQRLVAVRLLEKSGLTNLKIIERPIREFSQDFCFAVKEGDREMLSILNEGLALAVADGTHRRLRAKWFADLELPQDRPVVVGGDHSYPPFEFLDEKGRPAGFTVELTRAIARELNLDLRIRLGRWEDMVNLLRDGKIDALEGMFYSPERDRVLDFSPKYLVIHCVSVVRKGEGPPPTIIEEFQGRDLVVQAEDAILEALAERDIKVRVTTVETQEDVVRSVAEGRNDCGLVTRFGALYAIQKNGWTNIAVGDRAFYSGQYCYATPQGNEALIAEFTEGLRVLKDSGEYQRIYEKWLGVYEPGISTRTVLKYAALIAGPLLSVALLALLWSWSLRRQVSARTRELSASNQQLRTAQETLRQSEERFRLARFLSGVGAWEWNVASNEVFWSDEVIALFGFGPGEFDGTFDAVAARVHPEDFDAWRENIQSCVEEGEEYSTEFRILRSDGAIRWIGVFGNAERDADGNAVRLIGVAMDITKRKLAETKLHYQEMLLREMGRIAHIGGWEFDPDTRQGTWTDEVARIHDLDPADETNLEIGLRFFKDESRAKIDRAVKEAIESGKPYDLELELVSAKGVHKWVRTIGSPIVEDGKVVRVCGSFQDITDRKRSENALKEANDIINRSASVAFTWENTTGWPVAFVSENVRRLLGYKAEEFISGAVSYTDCIHAQDRPRVIEEVAKMSAPEKAEEFVHEPYRVIAKDGSEKLVRDWTFIVRGNDGRITHYKGIVEDITTQRNLESRLVQAQKMEAVGRLAGGVAHDYNNFLSVIIGYAELAMDKLAAEDPLREDLKEIHTAANRSRSITNQLLAFARKETIEPEALDLNATVDNMLKILKKLIGEDIDLAWHPGPVSRPVLMDPSQLDQILANLCVNARDAITDVGRITIETSMVDIDAAYCSGRPGFIPGEYVLLIVSDDGHGMDRVTMDHIFEPFFTTKGVGKGTGLGLSTVYGIVKQNNGFINVYSEPGSGTTVRIYLPGQSDGISEKPKTIDEQVPNGNGETLLVVEDEISILKLVGRILSRCNYKVLLTSSPSEALEVAQAHSGRISLLITDVVMPEMNGRELVAQIKKLHPEIKCIFMSGYTADVIAHRGVLDKGIQFIQKPFSTKGLTAKVKEILGHEPQSI